MSGITPQDWFLTATEARRHPAYTSGNAVAALIDGQAYMASFLDKLQSVRSGDYVHLVGWRMNPGIRLLGDVPNSPSILEVLTERAHAGATIRSLLWYVPGTIGDFGAGHGSENLEMTQILTGLGQAAVMDDRLPNGAFASHHQKFIVLSSAGQHTAFIGGIDIAPDRWDRSEHDEPLGRQREFFDAWHDVQAQVEGPALEQLWDTFAERWNDRRRPNGAPSTAGNATPTAIPISTRPSQAQKGTCHVQVLHTYACKSRTFTAGQEDVYPFAPNGDRSYEFALVKAIDAARYFIYVEDQYLWPCRVVDALASAAARGVTVIIVVTNNYDVQGLKPYHNYLQQVSADQIKSGVPNRVFWYHLRQSGQGGQDIYVHSKTLVIDDRYAVIGSANINQRSMSTDTEIGVAVVDDTIDSAQIGGQQMQICRFAREYRKQLWREHLGMTSDDPLNADGSPKGWPTAANQQVGHAAMHTVAEPRLCRPAFIPNTLMNPETTCQ